MASDGVRPPLIGVLGGMGPLATVDFLHKLVFEMPAAVDQDHVPVLAWNVAQIPDRQQALACTEVPLALGRLGSRLLPISIDTNRALALACIRYWQKARR